MWERILRLRLAFIYNRLAFRKQKNIRIPGAGRPETKGKKSFEDMEDTLTLVLIIVLCLVFKPLIAAILRGLGSSEHRRDR